MRHRNSVGEAQNARTQPKRDIVDTTSHASRATRHNTTKQHAFSTTWGGTKRATMGQWLYTVQLIKFNCVVGDAIEPSPLLVQLVEWAMKVNRVA